MDVIVDYGMGNVNSIANMLRKIGAAAEISREPSVIEDADRLILPGVGAFDRAMTNLADMGLIDLLSELVLVRGKPVLGICLGLQLFAKSSEEGVLPGLGWIDGDVKRFRFEGAAGGLKIPHMGWDYVSAGRAGPLFDGLAGGRFYFVHSYHIVCNDGADELARTFYGYDFTSAVQRDNIVGVQFHPEKSHRFGMGLLRNFVRHF